MSTADLQVLALVLTGMIAVMNLFLIPLSKSALRGEASEMFEKHDDDPLAHPGLTMASREATALAAQRAAEAHAAAARTEQALGELRGEVADKFDRIAERLQELHDAFVAHDAWERKRRLWNPPARNSKKGK